MYKKSRCVFKGAPGSVVYRSCCCHIRVQMCIRDRLYTARQKDGVLTLDVPAEVATFRTTIEDMQALQANGVKTLVLVTEKNTTTLNLSLLCEGQKSGTRVTLRHLGSNATLSVGLRCRRDLLIGR